ncbi:PREDICTED: uncharacterized protein LOC105141873 isoform X2 [Populus euphratica]|uniref:Uncharacterized protein LOC105141873 isoform X2 n=1 Tax=Populus euphratica TaxID=75702 RepID=A0AAJ6VFP2_POPEU|nr:PREDICTED: uncharacterized protein LOC105141873 isoform X2 [Populus euphratica]
MGRRQNDSEPSRFISLTFLLAGFISCALVYTVLSVALNSNTNSKGSNFEPLTLAEESNDGGCCRGIEKLELWGGAVKWGSDHKFNSSKECCQACKAMCTGTDGPCLCDTWVFCGNKKACGSKFGEGIVGLETEYGTLHIKLFPDCAPYSVAYILELLTLRHCAGCQFYRAEGRGQLWDSEGNHIKKAPFGPPFAIIQGTLEAQGTTFKKIPTEECPYIRRGSVAWVGSGPEFFISLADHQEWKKAYTVFGSVLPEDMEIAEKIAQLPTISDVWNNINVSVLEKPVPLLVQRLNGWGNLNTDVKSD